MFFTGSRAISSHVCGQRTSYFEGDLPKPNQSISIALCVFFFFLFLSLKQPFLALF